MSITNGSDARVKIRHNIILLVAYVLEWTHETGPFRWVPQWVLPGLLGPLPYPAMMGHLE